MRGRIYLPAGLVLLALLGYLLIPQIAFALEPTIIQGQVVNGTNGGEVPANLDVTLHVIDPGGEVQTRTTATDSEGNFLFQQVPVNDSYVYAVSASYHDISYSRRLELPLGDVPMTLEVFETTEDLNTLSIDTHIWLVREIDGAHREIIALEMIALTNDQDRTFQPALEQPGKMNFLRFSLPPDATSLEVRSDLQEGQIINVGTGFGMTTPVLPGTHQIAFTYRIPYKSDGLALSHSFHQGASSFQAVLSQDLGGLQGPDLAEDDSTIIGERTFRVWAAQDLSPGSTVAMELYGLPQPSLWSRLGEGLTEGPYLRIGIPTALGLVLLALLIYAVMFRRAPSVPVSPLLAPNKPQFTENLSPLMEAIARLDDLYEERGIDEEGYRRRRAELKGRLLESTVAGSKTADKGGGLI